MRKIAYQLLPFMVVLMLAACSASGPKFSAATQPAKNEALIYLYRPDAPFFGGIQSHFYVDGNKVASLNKEGYTAFYLSPGAYTFKQHWSGMDELKNTIQFPVVLEPGEKRYYRLTIGIQSFSVLPAYKGLFMSASHQWFIANVPESDALGEIGLTHYQPPFNVKGAVKAAVD